MKFGIRLVSGLSLQTTKLKTRVQISLPPSEAARTGGIKLPFLTGDAVDIHALGTGEGLRLRLKAVGR